MSSQWCTAAHQAKAASIVLNPTYSPPGALQAERAMVACVVLAGILFLLSVIPITLRFMLRDKNFLGQSVHGYWSPNTPLLGSLMVACYSVLGVATALITRHHLMHYSIARDAQTILHLAAVIPAPHFLWAWLYAMSASASYHAMKKDAPSDGGRHMGPRVHNFLFIAFPTLVTIISVILLPIFVSITAFNENVAARLVVREHGYHAADIFWSDTINKCHLADRFYRSTWAMWGVWFVIAMVIYVWYSQRVYQELRSELALLDIESIRSGSGSSRPMGVVLQKERVKNTMEVTTLRIVKQNIKMGQLEMVAFSMYCLPWAVIGIYKALKGYDVFIGITIWITLISLEVFLAFICNGATLAIVTWRSYNIWKAQQRASCVRLAKGSVQVMVVTEQVETVTSEEEGLVGFEGDSMGGAYSDYPDIAQLVFTRPTPLHLPSSNSKLSSDAGDDRGAWSVPLGWNAAAPSASVERGGVALMVEQIGRRFSIK